MDFVSLGLEEWIQKMANKIEYRSPREIQQSAIPVMLEHKDVMICSETGSGKTAAFAFPILQELSKDPYGIFALILTANRELAVQIAEQFAIFGASMTLKIQLLIGGVSSQKQIQGLQQIPHIVIATPGRCNELLDDDTFSKYLKNVRYLVLDEVDRLLEPQIWRDIESIRAHLEQPQLVLVSATMPSLDLFPNVEICKGTVSTLKIKHKFILMPDLVKEFYFIYLMRKLESASTIVFAQTCRKCHELNLLLNSLGMTSTTLHSMLPQKERMGNLRSFRGQKVQILVATDVASRGLDIQCVKFVVNFNVPKLSSDYQHRIGRTGRAGRQGTAITLMTQFDVGRIKKIEKDLDITLQEIKFNEDKVLEDMAHVTKVQKQIKLVLLVNILSKWLRMELQINLPQWQSRRKMQNDYNYKMDFDAIQGCVDQLSQIIQENVLLIDNFTVMFRNCQSAQEIIDLNEALNYELRIRNLEALSLITIIRTPRVTIVPKNSEIVNIITHEKALSSMKELKQCPLVEYTWAIDIDQLTTGWKCFIDEPLNGSLVTVLGDSGKTHILNSVFGINLQGSTRSISFKQHEDFTLVDTAGAQSKSQDRCTIGQFIDDIVFEIGDYFICVVNNYSDIEQRYVNNLSNKLKHSIKSFKDLIVVHNVKNSTDIILEQQWWLMTQYLNGTIQKEQVIANSSFTNQLEERPTRWFKSDNTRHIFIVDDQSDLGRSINPWTYALIKSWFQSTQKQLQSEELLNVINLQLSAYLKKSVTIELQDTFSKEKRLIWKIPTSMTQDISESEYKPSVDIIEGDKYIILVDIPGVQDIEVYRQNVNTIIRGYRGHLPGDYLQNERQHGSFELRFKIPTKYDRKWSHLIQNKGVLEIVYEQDIDEIMKK